MDYKKIDQLIMKYLVILGCIWFVLYRTDLLLFLINKIVQAFSTIGIALLVAFVLNLVMVRYQDVLKNTKISFLDKYKVVISLLLSLITIVFVIYSLCMLVIPEILNSITLLLDVVPHHTQSIFDRLVLFFEDAPSIATVLESIQIDWKSLFDNTMSFMGNGFTDFIDTTITMTLSVLGTAFNSILVVVFSIYLVLEKNRLLQTINRVIKLYTSNKQYRRIKYIYVTVNDTFGSFISGQCMEAVILGTLCALGMTLFRMPYAVMIGTLVGTINIIPIVGAYIGGSIGAFLVFTVSPTTAFFFVCYLIILQQFESTIIYPRVVGNSVGLPGIYVLATVMVFGSLAGIPGMFLGIPIVASGYKLLKVYIEKKENNCLK